MIVLCISEVVECSVDCIGEVGQCFDDCPCTVEAEQNSNDCSLLG